MARKDNSGPILSCYITCQTFIHITPMVFLASRINEFIVYVISFQVTSYVRPISSLMSSVLGSYDDIFRYTSKTLTNERVSLPEELENDLISQDLIKITIVAISFSSAHINIGNENLK